MNIKTFEIGSVVQAKTPIWNNHGTRLEAGQTAVVRDRYPRDAENPRTIGIKLPDGGLLIDIVYPEKVLDDLGQGLNAATQKTKKLKGLRHG